MGFVRDRVDLLHGEGDADERRAKPACAQCGDRAVVVALAVAEPCSRRSKPTTGTMMRSGSRSGAASTGTMVPKPPGTSAWPGS